jgi:hypothetical protein
MKVCHRCRTAWTESGQPGFNNTCAGCGMSLHACANCRWHVPQSRKLRCLKPGTPAVSDANAGNRCPAFEFLVMDAAVAVRAASAEGDRSGRTPREQWERLFGGGA